MAHFTHVRMGQNFSLHALCEPFRVDGSVLKDGLGAENVLHCQRRRAGQRIPGVGVAVHEGLALAVVGVKSIVDRLSRHGDGHGKIAPGKALGDRHDIRRYPGVIAGEHATGAAKACSDLVGDEKHPGLVAELPELFEVEGRIDPHPGAPLKKRLHDDGRRFLPVNLKGFFRMRETFTLTVIPIFSIGTAIAIRRFHMNVLHHHGLVHLSVEVEAPHGQRPDGFSVIALGKTHEFLPLRVPRLQVVLKAHLEGRFHRRRAVVIEVKLRQPLGYDLRQGFRQANGGFVGKIGEDDVFEIVDLFLHRLIDNGIAVAEKIAPPRTDNVQILLPVDIVKPHPLRPSDHHGGQRLIILHLSRRMPDVPHVSAFPILLFQCHPASLLSKFDQGAVTPVFPDFIYTARPKPRGRCPARCSRASHKQ